MMEARTSFGYMPLYIADYMADTPHLSTLEHGSYLLLIMAYWKSGKPLPASDFRLANICHLSLDAWQAIKPTMAEFFVIAGDQWEHKRIEKELQHFREKSVKAKTARLAGLEKQRREKEALQAQLLDLKNTSNNTNGRSTDVQRTFNHSGRSTDVDIKNRSENSNSSNINIDTNGRSTDVQRTFNHADADALNTEYYGSIEVLSNTEKFSPPLPSKREKAPSDSQLQEVLEAFDRHQCHANKEPRDLVIQQVISMNGKMDWKKFRANHAGYCRFWDEKGWNFCKLTFLGWINAGFPPAPDQKKSTPASESKYQEFSVPTPPED